jgi:hypothetical protein
MTIISIIAIVGQVINHVLAYEESSKIAEIVDKCYQPARWDDSGPIFKTYISERWETCFNLRDRYTCHPVNEMMYMRLSVGQKIKVSYSIGYIDKKPIIKSLE